MKTELTGPRHVARSGPLWGSSRAVTVVTKRGLWNLMKGENTEEMRKNCSIPEKMSKERKGGCGGVEESGCKLGRYWTGHSDKTCYRSIPKEVNYLLLILISYIISKCSSLD